MNKKNIYYCFFILFIFLSNLVYSQHNWLKDIIFRIDTNVVSYKKDKILYQNKEVIPLRYRVNQEIVEISILLQNNKNIKEIKVGSSKFYNIIESPEKKESDIISYTIQFIDATIANFVKHKIFVITYDNDTTILEISLQPISDQQIQIFPSQDELYVGEEVTWELITNIPENILTSNIWTEKETYRYRIIEQGGNKYLQLIPTQIGKQQFMIECPYTNLL